MARYQVTHPGFYILSIISLAILLVLIGLFVSGYFFSQHYSQEFKENIKLIAEIEPGTASDEIDKIVSGVQKFEGVRQESVIFISKEQALEEMSDEIGESEMMQGMENPFLDMIEFSMLEEHMNEESVDALESKLSSTYAIVSVNRPQSFFGDVFALLNNLRIYILIFILIALGLSGVLIHHIMRLNVVAQRDQIRTMELVGARPGFIVKPYVRKGIQMGLTSWLLALALTGALWFFMLGNAGFLSLIQSPSTILGALILLVIAVITCSASTWIAVMKSVGRTYV